MQSDFPQKLFGTDGVRGHANLFPMTVEIAMALGKAAGVLFRRQGEKHRVVIGKDTRLSCYMFENALIAGLCSMGVDTLMVGPLPTPGVAFMVRAYRADAGIVISASHNPFHDNGIKFFSRDGFKLPDELEKEIESLAIAGDFNKYLPKDTGIGRNSRVVEAYGRYIEFAKATFPKNKSLYPLKIVVDCANGAAYKVAPLVFQELDAKVITLGVEPDGLNINQEVGALYPEKLRRTVIEHKADVGIALDGDADRVIMVDENAQIIDGDTILAICALDMKKRGDLTSGRVVGTVMSNFGFLKTMQEAGIEVLQSKVGDRYVIQMMREYGCNLGGEQSGHLIFLDHNTTGDGIVAALQVLRIMIDTDSKLSDLAAVVKKYPQVLENVKVCKKKPIEEIPEVVKAIKSVEEKLDSTGRVLVRYSGTENLLRVMVEAPKLKLATSLAREIATVIEMSEVGKAVEKA
jgi:phosphoglucosamine mutase